MPSARLVSPLRRNLRASIADGAAFSLMVGLGESYLPAFVLAVGLGEVAAGLIATVPMLGGALLQLISPLGVGWLGSHRRWVIFCATVQALVFVPLVFSAWQGSIHTATAFSLATLYWGSSLGAGPAWNTWIGRIVPPSIRPQFFATRTRVTQVAVFAGLMGAGVLLDRAAVRNSPLIGFAILFSLAGMFRLVSVGFLKRQSEPETMPPPDRNVSPFSLLRRVRKAEGRLLVYMLTVQATTQLAAPYFTPYMLRQLHLPYLSYVTLLGASFAAKIIMLPLLGRFAVRFGARRLIWIGGMSIVPLAALWLVSSSVPYLLSIQLLAGVGWACYELSTVLLLFETIPDEERTSILTTFNLVNAAAILAGSLAGGLLLRFAGENREGYMLLFVVSSLGRVLTLPLLARVIDKPILPGMIGIRTLAVRPSAGSIDRPILSSIPEWSPERSEPAGESS